MSRRARAAKIFASTPPAFRSLPKRLTLPSPVHATWNLEQHILAVDNMRIARCSITRLQFVRDRVIGDSQVRIDSVDVAAQGLITDSKQIRHGCWPPGMSRASETGRPDRVASWDPGIGRPARLRPPAAMLHPVAAISAPLLRFRYGKSIRDRKARAAPFTGSASSPRK